ncbi:ABC transporter ATP-binding protein [Streptomyces sp. NPDC002577]
MVVSVRFLFGRVRLFRELPAAGRPLVSAMAVLVLLEGLVPAATALSMGALVDAVGRPASSGLLAAALGPLLAFGAALLAGHLLESAAEPLDFAIRARIDGAHRTRVMRLAALGPTIGALEGQRAQQLVRAAKAMPENWTERTPAAGALAQLRLAASMIGLIASCGVLARYAWWAIPLLLAPAVLNHVLRSQQALAYGQLWRAGLIHGFRAGVWQAASLSAGEGKEIRVYGLGDWATERALDHTRTMFGPVWGAGLRTARREWSQLLLVGVPLLVTFASVAAAAARGEATVETETAVLAAGWSVYQVLKYGEGVRDTHGALECLRAHDELGRVLEPAAEGPAGSSPVPAGPPRVRFENVSFAYPGIGRTVLDGIDLEICPGELLAIVGLNGAGKSTLIKLLSGLYDPTSGRITADGTDIAELGVDQWRRRMSVVFQDFVKYPLTAADNVTLGKATAPPDQEAVEAAARDAGLDTLVDRLPQRWQTPLARSRTGGVDLSGGQWQQVVLGRALYALRAGAGLLVLDEPTAHLDVRTEFEVFERLAARKSQASVVLISHRLSTVRQADRIVLLDGGRITESGTHDELMRLGGGYARMFAIQAERFARGADHGDEQLMDLMEGEAR